MCPSKLSDVLWELAVTAARLEFRSPAPARVESACDVGKTACRAERGEQIGALSKPDVFEAEFGIRHE